MLTRGSRSLKHPSRRKRFSSRQATPRTPNGVVPQRLLGNVVPRPGICRAGSAATHFPSVQLYKALMSCAAETSGKCSSHRGNPPSPPPGLQKVSGSFLKGAVPPETSVWVVCMLELQNLQMLGALPAFHISLRMKFVPLLRQCTTYPWKMFRVKEVIAKGWKSIGADYS